MHRRGQAFAEAADRATETGDNPGSRVDENRWEIAGPRACPRLCVVDEDLVTRPASAREVTTIEAIYLALARLVRDEDAALPSPF